MNKIDIVKIDFYKNDIQKIILKFYTNFKIDKCFLFNNNYIIKGHFKTSLVNMSIIFEKHNIVAKPNIYKSIELRKIIIKYLKQKTNVLSI